MLVSVVWAAAKVHVGVHELMLIFMAHAVIEVMLESLVLLGILLGVVLISVASVTTEGHVNIHDLCCS